MGLWNHSIYVGNFTASLLFTWKLNRRYDVKNGIPFKYSKKFSRVFLKRKAISLVQHLLEKEPINRYMPCDGLNHPFISKDDQKIVPLTLSETLRNIFLENKIKNVFYNQVMNIMILISFQKLKSKLNLREVSTKKFEKLKTRKLFQNYLNLNYIQKSNENKLSLFVKHSLSNNKQSKKVIFSRITMIKQIKKISQEIM